uniref:Protein kinase domain-containing protein n=1 Tax=Percolomonas cosmopolitus TaxID=63605 RepID=A0A6U0LRA3_9EUKA|mmetsp:Transcript_8991/g.33164  ORF Transcript_8991/g.33164 Transcript_8991/m.33164 type:complete len:354 (+) Transcript_8991:1036-2097(+)|eukprot:CAMPEP_0117441496 /NCGR_PEP_ID=MMETSP0759-20121206/3665_1 /TAXON_ID=63605 /ORGANISM="Percolomonas cosmopolitus, Strain WS" /LENGTH=353 /DNA_ID=CAMNT_0005233353 /DNA_START=916 /DNA_END=1977 /DNA_ORIENTATION=-
MTQLFGQTAAAFCVMPQDAAVTRPRNFSAHLEQDFVVMSRGPKFEDSFDLDSGYDIARRVCLYRTQTAPENRAVCWISDKLKKNAFTLKYQLGRLIDEGTYAKVYRCYTNDSFEKEYAVKVMDKQQMISLGMLPYLRREVSILKQIRNASGVCKFIDFMETGDKFYLVLELLHGGSLDREFFTYEECELRSFTFQVAKTLKHLHGIGIFHADLQLGNICKVNKSTACTKVKLVDFGLSDYCSRGKKHCRCVGNLYYAAPEMLLQKEYEGPEIDIWALGVCLFKLATGYRPFKNSDAIINGKFMIPLEDEDQLSDECKNLITEILQVDPAKRLNIEQILDHPFFDACREDTNKI